MTTPVFNAKIGFPAHELPLEVRKIKIGEKNFFEIFQRGRYPLVRKSRFSGPPFSRFLKFFGAIKKYVYPNFLSRIRIAKIYGGLDLKNFVIQTPQNAKNRLFQDFGKISKKNFFPRVLLVMTSKGNFGVGNPFFDIKKVVTKIKIEKFRKNPLFWPKNGFFGTFFKKCNFLLSNWQ